MAHETRLELAASSITSKDVNEDAYQCWQGSTMHAVIIADGIGSSLDAHLASALVVQRCVEHLQHLEHSGSPVDFQAIHGLWSEVALALRDQYDRERAVYQQAPKEVLSTTMAVVLELPTSYMISSLGNGSILQVRGNFWEFWGRRQWPWCVTELMIGDTFLNEGGQETLEGFLSPEGVRGHVHIMQVEKNPRYGELFILCSDGVHSPDHLHLGQDRTHTLWLEVNPHLIALLNTALRDYFEERTSLQAMVQDFLATRTFDDDATLGLLVSSQARTYFREHQDML